MKGIIKFYKDKQGYGFVTAEDNKDYYFHISDVEEQDKLKIQNGQIITFVPFETRRGINAKGISISTETELKNADDYLPKIEEKSKIIDTAKLEIFFIYVCIIINLLLFFSSHSSNLVLLLSVLLILTLISLLFIKHNHKK